MTAMFGTLLHRRPRKRRVLAIASGGGHWIQLCRVTPAFADCDVVYVTTLPSYRDDVGVARFYVVNDANLRRKCALMLMFLRLATILVWERPDVIVSTGAAPGYLACRVGRLLRAKTVWIDSMANAEELSVSGRKIGRHADLWLTQWPHLARPAGPAYAGAVL